jgi:transposase
VKKLSSESIAIALDSKVSYSTVLRVLKSSKFAKYAKKKPAPSLRPHHRKARIKFAVKYINKPGFWRRIVFSDEKKFNLDGPDGYRYYWYDVRQDPEIFSKRVCGGGSVMVWAAVNWHGKTEIVILEGRQAAVDYTQTLSNSMQPFLRKLSVEHGVADPIFQQDNASIHSAKLTTAFLKEKEVNTLSWPSKSPDLNIIENVWGQLSRAVYRDGRQLESTADLKRQIVASWEEIKTNSIQTLVDSMPTRMAQVVLRRGGPIDY